MKFDERGYPIEERGSRHLAGIEEFLKAYSGADSHHPFVVENIPTPEEIRSLGSRRFLK